MFKATAILAAALLLTGCASAAAQPADETPAPVVVTPEPTPADEVHGFATTGWDIRTDVMSPFYDRVQVNPHEKEIDDAGVAVYRHRFTGEVEPHPIAVAQYAMAALREWERTGDPMWFDRAVANGQRLVDTHTERNGAWWFQYDWDWTYIDRTLTAPWWSGMAQGEALTVFSRLAAAQPDNPVWRDAADRTWASFLQRGTGNTIPWSTLVVDGHLWFEEYAGNQPPLLVLNGHVFAIYGLWEYYTLTGNPTVADYIDGAATTVLDSMPRFRAEGDGSFYCAIDYCHEKNWKNLGYHPIHVQQLRALERITGDARFGEWANLLIQDHPIG